jgi:hypothetical protein
MAADGEFMFRNFFALLSTLLLGASAASASTPDATKNLTLQQRVEAAQKTIAKLMVHSEQGAKSDRERVAASWTRPWSNWTNWRNWFQNWRTNPSGPQSKPSVPSKPSLKK